jgi:hypothetical protein
MILYIGALISTIHVYACIDSHSETLKVSSDRRSGDLVSGILFHDAYSGQVMLAILVVNRKDRRLVAWIIGKMRQTNPSIAKGLAI